MYVDVFMDNTSVISALWQTEWTIMFNLTYFCADTEPELESQSLLKEVPSLPVATSTQNQFSKQNSGGMSVDGITLSQRPKPTQFSPSLSSGKSIRDPSQEHDRERAVSPPSWLVHNTAPPSEQRPLVSPDASQNPSASPPTKATKVSVNGINDILLYSCIIWYDSCF